jgi:ABC-type transport system involved in Fe-S cluster assembly fused permease/ATPase subunit
LSTIIDADEIIVLSAGKNAERGGNNKKAAERAERGTGAEAMPGD